jgi:hypothetical protein
MIHRLHRLRRLLLAVDHRQEARNLFLVIVSPFVRGVIGTQNEICVICVICGFQLDLG